MGGLTIAVVGLWHQGVVGAACLADMGHRVIGVDSDSSRISALTDGKTPLFEPGLDDLLTKGLATGRLTFTVDGAKAVREADLVFVMFDTPVDENDQSDVSGIFQAVEAIGPSLRKGACILVTAQVPVGTCDELAARLRKTAAGADVTFAYMPENLRLGQAIERFMAPPLPVIGCDDPATFNRLMVALAPLAPEWHRVGLRTAEMMKHALNAFLALNICFANELGNICDAIGADGKRIGQLLRLEPRVGPKSMLSPGLGFSGGTLARDMQTLRRLGREHGLGTPLLDGAWQANAEQNRLVMRKLEQALGDLGGKKVAVLGLTYKPDTSTLRRSAAMEVIASLVEAGAVVSAHDPRADRDEIKSYTGFSLREAPMEAIAGAEALVLMTPWDDYRSLDFESVKRLMAYPYVLDTAGLWDAEGLTAIGIRFDDIGRGRRQLC